jgi:hypothetical protein
MCIEFEEVQFGEAEYLYAAITDEAGYSENNFI